MKRVLCINDTLYSICMYACIHTSAKVCTMMVWCSNDTLEVQHWYVYMVAR